MFFGNRTTADGITYVPNELNQYTEVDSAAFYYDGNGNLIDDGVNTYTYDSASRLESVVYAYDALDRRVSKTVDGVTTYFIYDGDREIAEYDSLGSLEAEYTYGTGIDEVLTMDRGGTMYYYFTDGLGSVTEITDETGEVVESYEYDVYGEPTIRDAGYGIRDTPVLRSQTQEQFGVAGSSIGNPYLFTGRRLDEESGLYHYRARAYDPKIGRFLQRDPLGYTDSMNLFEYVYNNPVNYLDPWGLACGGSGGGNFLKNVLIGVLDEAFPKNNIGGTLAAVKATFDLKDTISDKNLSTREKIQIGIAQTSATLFSFSAGTVVSVLGGVAGGPMTGITLGALTVTITSAYTGAIIQKKRERFYENKDKFYY